MLVLNPEDIAALQLLTTPISVLIRGPPWECVAFDDLIDNSNAQVSWRGRDNMRILFVCVTHQASGGSSRSPKQPTQSVKIYCHEL